jgi:DNA ligase (NAD+)
MTSVSAMTTTILAARLEAASHAYHNGLPLLMTDAEFDAGVDQLRAIDPTHPFLATVGAPTTAGDEVPLPIPLPSLNKIKAEDGSLTKWLGKYAATVATYHISVKLDGCSALWLPATRKLYTRGDGMRGRDISVLAPHITGLGAATATSPLTAIRGELIMRTDSPAIPAGKLARNIVAGALNRKFTDIDTALMAEIRFIAYEVVAPATLTPEEAYRQLRIAGYEVAASSARTATEEMSETYLSELFSKAELKSPYQLDGIVVAPNVARPAAWKPEIRNGASVNPADRVAWKTRLTAQTATTTVRTVDWNVSASGMLIPRVLFDPVTLAGATIGAATGLHGRWIHDNAVGPGARIEVRRAGDVIPQIIAVHVASPTGPSMPPAFVWDGEPTTAVHIKVGTEANDDLLVTQLTYALSELGAENVGPGIVAKLFAAGYRNLAAIYGASQAEFAARVEGVKAKGAERIWAGLRAKQSAWTELNMMVASCTMPRCVGHTKLRPLLSLNPAPASWTPAELKAARPAGLSDKTIDDICAALPAYIAWRTANPLSVVAAADTVTSTPAATAGPATTIVFTGSRDKELEAALAAAGHTVAAAVSKKTTHVVFPDGPAPTSSKITKAQELGIPLMTISALRATLGL